MQVSNATPERTLKRRIRRLSPCALTWIAMFGFVAVSASRAEATCGDYLSHPEPAGVVLGSMAGDNHPMDDNSGRIPCHGPSCRRMPTQLPLSSPVVSVDTQDRWGWMASFMMPDADQASFLPRLSEPISLPMIAYRLDRPPKI